MTEEKPEYTKIENMTWHDPKISENREEWKLRKQITGLNISIENDHLSGELIRGQNRLYAKLGELEFEIMRVVDKSTGNRFEGLIDLGGDIFFVADHIDKSPQFQGGDRSAWFDIYLNDVPIYERCKMTHFDPLTHRGVQVAHFRAMRGINLDRLLASVE